MLRGVQSPRRARSWSGVHCRWLQPSSVRPNAPALPGAACCTLCGHCRPCCQLRPNPARNLLPCLERLHAAVDASRGCAEAAGGAPAVHAAGGALAGKSGDDMCSEHLQWPGQASCRHYAPPSPCMDDAYRSGAARRWHSNEPPVRLCAVHLQYTVAGRRSHLQPWPECERARPAA